MFQLNTYRLSTGKKQSKRIITLQFTVKQHLLLIFISIYK
jgi:hypothetical protein